MTARRRLSSAGPRERVPVRPDLEATVVRTALGRFALAASARGVVALAPAGAGAGRAALTPLRRPLAARLDRVRLVPRARAAGALARGARALERYARDPERPLAWPSDAVGTAFQRAVWRALAAVPAGRTTSYGAIAARLGRPRAARAVGAAVGRNPVAVLVPCHRAVGADGALHGFSWGLRLKRALLAHEGATR